MVAAMPSGSGIERHIATKTYGDTIRPAQNLFSLAEQRLGLPLLRTAFAASVDLLGGNAGDGYSPAHSPRARAVCGNAIPAAAVVLLRSPLAHRLRQLAVDLDARRRSSVLPEMSSAHRSALDVSWLRPSAPIRRKPPPIAPLDRNSHRRPGWGRGSNGPLRADQPTPPPPLSPPFKRSRLWRFRRGK